MTDTFSVGREKAVRKPVVGLPEPVFFGNAAGFWK
jgi:hypothetical protein